MQQAVVNNLRFNYLDNGRFQIDRDGLMLELDPWETAQLSRFLKDSLHGD